MGRGLSNEGLSPEEYAEHKMSAEGKAELTEPDIEDIPGETEAELSRDAAIEELRKDDEEEAGEMTPEYEQQLAEMGNYTRLEFRGEKYDDRIVLNVYVRDVGASERLLMTMERPGYNFGKLRRYRICFGGVYSHSQETERQLQYLERAEGFLIDEIRFFR